MSVAFINIFRAKRWVNCDPDTDNVGCMDLEIDKQISLKGMLT